MTDKKFTQKDIIKALEVCSSDAFNDSKERCTGCKYDGADKNHFCFEVLEKDALDLINRLKTRIVRYQLKNTNQRNALASLNKKVAEQKAEIERLDALWNSAQDNNFNILGLLHKMRKELQTAKEDNERHKAEVKWWRSQIRDTEDLLAEFDRPIVEVKNEAIKEFAERLKENLPRFADGYTTMECVEGTIQYLVKEMTEVEK